jgi:hypothetical protein
VTAQVRRHAGGEVEVGATLFFEQPEEDVEAGHG